MSIRSITTATTLVIALFSQASLAILPPLSQADREAMATNIVNGYVVSIKKEIQEVSYGTNAQYTVRLMVLDTKKGDSIKNEQTIEFKYWKADARVRGWCGDSGQNSTVKMYTLINAYLSYDDVTGDYHLLSPNGFDLDK